MSQSLAEGPLWTQQARYLLAPVLRPFIPLSRLDGQTVDGEPCRILVGGDSPTLRLLSAALLPPGPAAQALGRVPLPGLGRLLRREIERHDLVIARVPRVVAHHLARHTYLVMPELVNVRVAAEVVRRRRGQNRNAVGTAYRRWRREGFVAVPACDRAALDLFYDTMYVPYARWRFGEAAALRDRRLLRHLALSPAGTLLWIEQDGRRLAGVLVERRGDTLHVLSFGTPLEPTFAHKAGILTAATVAAVEFGLEAGAAWIDLGGSMPWLTDGVFLSKRYWGGELVLHPWQRQSLLVAWPRWAPAAAALLALAPFAMLGGTAYGLRTPTPSRRLTASDLALPGLRRFWIVADPPADEVPLTGLGYTRPGASHEILAQISPLMDGGLPA